MRPLLAFALPALLAACSWGSGSSWVNEPLAAEERASPSRSAMAPGRPMPVPARTLGARPMPGERESAEAPGGGRLVGVFRNTYYDFPSEGAASGDTQLVSLMNASCTEIAKVPRAFHDAVCVQGSGALRRGGTVSFAKRDCPCADICPRTSQKICFEALDPKVYPFGRGAAGKAIRPLRSVAADTHFLPMGTDIYVPELDGLAVGEGGSLHDGCLVVEDRGLKVRDAHIDIFTGRPHSTELVEEMLPSNQGVHVVVGTKRCSGSKRP